MSMVKAIIHSIETTATRPFEELDLFFPMDEWMALVEETLLEKHKQRRYQDPLPIDGTEKYVLVLMTSFGRVRCLPLEGVRS